MKETFQNIIWHRKKSKKSVNDVKFNAYEVYMNNQNEKMREMIHKLPRDK